MWPVCFIDRFTGNRGSVSYPRIVCDVPPSSNICPGEQVVSIICDGANRLAQFKWGLIPPWAKDPAIGYKLINARAETLAEKPSFRDAFKKNRCLIIADGFYEWKKDGKRKIPMYFFLRSGEPVAFAGLYSEWHSPGGQFIKSCTIITTDSNELIAPVHDRMPAILPKSARWNGSTREKGSRGGALHAEAVSIGRDGDPESRVASGTAGPCNTGHSKSTE